MEKEPLFKFECLNESQVDAMETIEKNIVTFLLGPAGSGKTFLACAYALKEAFSPAKKKIVLTRPIVSAGEELGFLPGDMGEKVEPFMAPLKDSFEKLVGNVDHSKETISRRTKLVPLAYMRGLTFDKSVCLLDEAQNATFMQLKLFITRFGNNSKVIITGDPEQSDIRNPALMDFISRLEGLEGIGIVKFSNDNIVRHPLIASILERLEDIGG